MKLLLFFIVLFSACAHDPNKHYRQESLGIVPCSEEEMTISDVGQGGGDLVTSRPTWKVSCRNKTYQCRSSLRYVNKGLIGHVEHDTPTTCVDLNQDTPTQKDLDPPHCCKCLIESKCINTNLFNCISVLKSSTLSELLSGDDEKNCTTKKCFQACESLF